MNVQIEKRRHKRDDAALEVRCESFGLDEIFVSRDVSSGGLFLKTPNPLVAGSVVELTFRVSPEEPTLECSGRVVYSLPGVGMGIQFLDTTGEIEVALNRTWHKAN
jgi:PilZ domain